MAHTVAVLPAGARIVSIATVILGVVPPCELSGFVLREAPQTRAATNCSMAWLVMGKGGMLVETKKHTVQNMQSNRVRQALMIQSEATASRLVGPKCLWPNSATYLTSWIN